MAVASVADKPVDVATNDESPKTDAQVDADKPVSELAGEKVIEPPTDEKAPDVAAADEPEASPKPAPANNDYADDETDDAEDADEAAKGSDQTKADAALKAAEAETKRKEQLAKLADSRQYALPINAVKRRRSRYISILGVLFIILLAVAWVDLAADAGFIDLPVQPVTHLFSTK
jgi:hypothetical protein